MRMWRNLVMCLGLIFVFGGCSQDDNSSAMRAQREAHTAMEWAQKAAYWGNQSSNFYSRIVEEYRRQCEERVACQQTCSKQAPAKVPTPRVTTDYAKGQVVIQYQTTTTTTQPPRQCCPTGIIIDQGTFHRDYMGQGWYIR